MENIFKLSEDGKVLLEVLDKNVVEVVIPKGIEKIEAGAFAFCDSLQKIHISSSVNHIGAWTFIPYPSLAIIDVASDNSYFTSVNGILFSKDLKHLIKFPSKCNINDYKIPANVTYIGESAFSCCNSLKYIDIPNSVKIIGQTAFAGCSSLKVIDLPNSLIYIGNSTFWDCKSLQCIDIPENVKFIGECAFSCCSALLDIYIPSTVNIIGSGAFDYCKFLRNIFVNSNNSHYISINGVLFDKEIQCLIKYPEGKKNLEYIIPNSIMMIDSGSFQDCINLQKLNIPGSVRHIKDNAFSFSSLRSIDIPDSVITIEDMAFGFCESLQTIRFYHKEIEKCKIADDIFEGIDFDQCTLYIPSGTRWAYRHHPVFSKFKNIVTERQA